MIIVITPIEQKVVEKVVLWYQRSYFHMMAREYLIEQLRGLSNLQKHLIQIILLHAIKENLKEAWNELAQDTSINNITKENIKSTLRVVIGSPSEKILEFANANQIDLIIMGSQRLETISKIKALGSVSRKVSRSEIALS